MDAYQRNREAIIRANEEVLDLLRKSAADLETHMPSFAQWTHACENISRYLMDHVVRIAVVGAIKSGKSTLVNALLKTDHLKRGAGVVTSIVTRVRRGSRLRARLFFKTWYEINTDIQQALALFPSNDWRSEEGAFDICREKDRIELKAALDALDISVHVVQDSLNAHGVLLSSYLKGYDRIKSYVTAESAIREFEGEAFADHRRFVADDAMAVYLKDIELEVVGDRPAANIEIADCQGSDSPNPLHLAMIQDYLLKAHLVIYVISSRTGIRQADIRFLSMIKRMGIAANMLFVCNCDFSEHDNMKDLNALVQRMVDELSMIVDQPVLFTLSALYNLFEADAQALSQKDLERLQYWRRFEEQVIFSDTQTAQMLDDLDRKLTRERSALLLQNQLERLDVTTTGLIQWVRLNRDLLRRDAGDAHSMAAKLDKHRSYMQQVQSTVQSTLEGAVRKIDKAIKIEVDRFFDYHTGPVQKMVMEFVRDYRVDLEQYREPLDTSGFTHTLYLVFQDMRQALDGFMAERINPEIMGFISKEQTRLEAELERLIQPYEAMVRDALLKYEDELVQFGAADKTVDWTFKVNSDLTTVKQAAGLSLPPAAATMRYSANIRTEAVLRFGFYALGRALRKALKKSVAAEKSEEMRALKDGIRRMKAETERSIAASFKDYRENLKFQYIQPLASFAGKRLYETLTERFTAYVGDVKSLVEEVAAHSGDKDRLKNALADIEEKLSAVKARLDVLRQDVSSLIQTGASDVKINQ
ncbi:MAG: hypothetical protein HKP58_06645 [Desulfatitalea sp.]|nr:dynamin family protein [Desulfatitalea sp.]NNK00076.1 hypothetical protein [Desulfatitalea sp.]